MKKKQFLAIILLSLSFCFVVSGGGYGEIIIPRPASTLDDFVANVQEKWWPYFEGLREDIGLLKLENALLNARISYMMSNPTNFPCVYILYDSSGWSEENFPEGVNTKKKIYVLFGDLRGYFAGRSGIALREAFKINLDAIYSFIKKLATDMDNDIVALFVSKGQIPLGYFYQGEYHLWQE